MDAFFDAVRRRHPDVDLVVLPPPPPPVDPQVGLRVTDDEVAGSLALVGAELERLWALSAPGPVPAPSPRLVYGDRLGTVVASARAAAHPSDGLVVLLHLRADLESRGFHVTRLDGRLEGLHAVLDEIGVDIALSETTGALTITVLGEPLPVGLERSRSLVRRSRSAR